PPSWAPPEPGNTSLSPPQDADSAASSPAIATTPTRIVMFIQKRSRLPASNLKPPLRSRRRRSSPNASICGSPKDVLQKHSERDIVVAWPHAQPIVVRERAHAQPCRDRSAR